MLRAADEMADARHEEQMKTLVRIEAQTTKTNGRVTKLEEVAATRKTEADVFKARVTTAIAIIVFLIGSVLVPLAAAYIAHIPATMTQ